MQNKKLVVILAIFVVVVIIAAIYIISPDKFSTLKNLSRTIGLEKETPQIIEENLVAPETKKITGSEGKTASSGPVEVPLVPKTEGEKVVVLKAILTIKGSYDLAGPETQRWSSDAKLVFIKSLGAITLEGKSSQWQLAFSSKTKVKKGYEIIIQADQIISKKEIDSTAVGADAPKQWKDLGDVIKELQSHPLYQDATVSAATFYLNPDNKKWYYTLSTSKGVSSIVIE